MKTVKYEINVNEYLDAVVLCGGGDDPNVFLLYVLETKTNCPFLVLAESKNGYFIDLEENYINEPDIKGLTKALKDIQLVDSKEYQQYLKLKKKYGNC